LVLYSGIVFWYCILVLYFGNVPKMWCILFSYYKNNLVHHK
jgi:hypothetical protein